MKKLLLLALLSIGTLSCEKDDCDGKREAIVYRFPERDNEFEMTFPYDCDSGEPIRDYYSDSYIVFVRWK